MISGASRAVFASKEAANRPKGRERAVVWLLQLLVVAVSAFLVAGPRLPARGLARSSVVSTVLATRLGAAVPREQCQRQRTRALIERDAFEADVADEDVDERDDDREALPVCTEAALLLRRSGAPRLPTRGVRGTPVQDPSRFVLGRGFSRGPPALLG